jgi:hypothetical protein
MNCCQFVLCNPVDGRDEEFNEWYSGHHLPRVLEVPGVLAGQRFKREAVGPWPRGNHEYLTIWEFDDPGFAIESLHAARNAQTLTVSESIDMKGIQPPTMWRRASIQSAHRYRCDSSDRRALLLAMFNTSNGATVPESTIFGQTLPALADAAGIERAEFFTLAEEQLRNSARKLQYAIVAELADEAAALEALTTPTDRIAWPFVEHERFFAAVFRPCAPRQLAAARDGT